MGGGGRESDYSVCPRPLLQFLQFFQFMSVRLHQVMSGYVSLHQFMSVYVSLLQFTSVYVHWRDGMWSSTIRSVLKFEAFKKKYNEEIDF